LDRFASVAAPSALVASEDVIGFKNAHFTWSAQAASTTESPAQTFALHVDGEVTFRTGVVNLIIGKLAELGGMS
jgi:hypothetical protein